MKPNDCPELETHPFFLKLRPEHLRMFADCAELMRFNSGTTIFREGEPASRFYLIRSGQVVLETGGPPAGPVEVQRLGPGELLGWSWLFAPFVWHFHARAVTPVDVLVLNGARLLVAAEGDHEFGFELMRRLTQVLIQRLQATRKQVVERQIESALEG
jgi:CRP/FNR family cyclic AMP-dependent transcriptional regulator